MADYLILKPTLGDFSISLSTKRPNIAGTGLARYRKCQILGQSGRFVGKVADMFQHRPLLVHFLASQKIFKDFVAELVTVVAFQIYETVTYFL